MPPFSADSSAFVQSWPNACKNVSKISHNFSWPNKNLKLKFYCNWFVAHAGFWWFMALVQDKCSTTESNITDCRKLNRERQICDHCNVQQYRLTSICDTGHLHLKPCRLQLTRPVNGILLLSSLVLIRLTEIAVIQMAVWCTMAWLTAQSFHGLCLQTTNTHTHMFKVGEGRNLI